MRMRLMRPQRKSLIAPKPIRSQTGVVQIHGKHHIKNDREPVQVTILAIGLRSLIKTVDEHRESMTGIVQTTKSEVDLLR
ncbi:MAG: hypothetical protein BFD77_08030 [Pseudomonas sp. CO183]|nr:MAG: hypothetical protein BFD77_08030 [Pseudomonas sp. CO183]